MKLEFLSQIWLRYTEANQGSTVFGEAVDNVFDIGLWHLENVTDTTFDDLLLLGTDIFYDQPTNVEKGDALTIYASVHKFDLGPNYTRNVGVMNPANGSNNPQIFNGAGDAVTLIGTGTVFYAQMGYLFGSLLPKEPSTLCRCSICELGWIK